VDWAAATFGKSPQAISMSNVQANGVVRTFIYPAFVRLISRKPYYRSARRDPPAAHSVHLAGNCRPAPFCCRIRRGATDFQAVLCGPIPAATAIACLLSAAIDLTLGFADNFHGRRVTARRLAHLRGSGS